MISRVLSPYFWQVVSWDTFWKLFFSYLTLIADPP
jgi:hypothetical protein